MTKTANGLDVRDEARIDELGWCTVAREGVPLFNGTPREIVHDTGDRIWFFVNNIDEPFPPELNIIEDDGAEYADIQGNFIVSVPAEWCNLIDEDDAEILFQQAVSERTYVN